MKILHKSINIHLHGQHKKIIFKYYQVLVGGVPMWNKKGKNKSNSSFFSFAVEYSETWATWFLDFISNLLQLHERMSTCYRLIKNIYFVL